MTERDVPGRERDEAAVSTANVEVDGVRVFFRRRGGDGPPTVFVHGNPTHSVDWLPFLERMKGPAIALDLPGWGRSDDPGPERFDYSIHGQAAFFDRFLDALGVSSYSLVVHDWGSVALITAQRQPERLRRLVAFNCVPLGCSYRWHWIARYFWRRRILGELFNAAATKPALRLLGRLATARPGPLPEEMVEAMWSHWRRGTWPAMLRLYRSADPEVLDAAGERLGALVCPALVLWASRDPYIPAEYGRRLAARLGDAELEEVAGAGHWPWIDRPELVGRTLSFLSAGPA